MIRAGARVSPGIQQMPRDDRAQRIGSCGNGKSAPATGLFRVILPQASGAAGSGDTFFTIFS
ncbi:hypothetical protein SDC9_131552 [bioreactor metagenome]|uniref:Uncharacterized protein n=1 Tax=bioreactor metagenome TaxID=1076179 RepID=A0A645D4R8_9ZZZZ